MSLKTVQFGVFMIDIELVTRADLKKIRTFLPKKDYVNLKNRKTARMQRQKQKREGINR